MMYDVIIIGKGPAGISTSLYARRSNLNVLVIGLDDSALLKAKVIDNYYGTPVDVIQDKLNQGIDVILVIEIQGALKIKEMLEETVFIFIFF